MIEERPKMKNLFSPISIKSMVLKNRIVMPPMTTLLGNADGTLSDRFIDYYAARASGGAALITTETADIHPYTHNLSLGDRGFTAIYDDKFIPDFKRFTDKIHTFGAKCSIQLHHTGRAMPMLDPSKPPLAPSEMPYPGGIVPRPLTIGEIEGLVEAFGEGAFRAKEAGFDAVDIHAGHGYLIAQFMSPLVNRRTDRYGGDLLGRLRFAIEALGAVRKRVGEDFPIIFRFSADERVPGGRSITESVAIAQLLVEAGADCLSITTGMHYTLFYTVPAMGLPNGINVEDTAAVKAAVNVPVIAVGRLNDPVIAESVLAEGKADLIAIGRGLIADPELPIKWEQGRFEDVRPCISCNQGCIGAMMSAAPFSCVVNVAAGHEPGMEMMPSQHPKHVLVAGGGPAGMEAALTAATRGHTVTLCEKLDHLGGQFYIAAMPPGKQAITLYLKYMATQLKRSGVEIVLNHEVDASTVANINPDVVVVATGGRPSFPKITGADEASIVAASDVFKGQVVVGQRVLIAGGGLVGCETALFLDQLGKHVTIVEMMPDLACDQIIVPRQALLLKLGQTKVKVVTSTTIVGFNKRSVTIEHEGNRETVDDIDTIVLALGVDSDNELAEAIKGTISEMHAIGDADKPSNAMDAIATGAQVGRQI